MAFHLPQALLTSNNSFSGSWLAVRVFFVKMGKKYRELGAMVTNWLQIAYQYGVGGLFFAATLWLVFRQGGASLKSRQDRWLLRVLLAGYFGYLIANIAWAYLARF